MTVYLIPNPTRELAAPVAREAAALLLADGLHIIAQESHRPLLQAVEGVAFTSKEKAFEKCDLVVTVGGDGTILHSARHTFASQKPLLGINTGRLGFLTIVERDELQKLHRIAKGEYSVENRSVLEVAYGTEISFALNDVLLFKQAPESTIGLDIYCDDSIVSSFRGDGVVFATPTGSTAYSMSAGGPIVDARLGGIIATQICPHIIQTPPMVFAGDRVLRIEQETERQIVCVSCDGRGSKQVPAGETVWVRQSEHFLPLIQFADADQMKSIDKKLKGR